MHWLRETSISAEDQSALQNFKRAIGSNTAGTGGRTASAISRARGTYYPMVACRTNPGITALDGKETGGNGEGECDGLPALLRSASATMGP